MSTKKNQMLEMATEKLADYFSYETGETKW
jgi:hypothetical protein